MESTKSHFLNRSSCRVFPYNRGKSFFSGATAAFWNNFWSSCVCSGLSTPIPVERISERTLYSLIEVFRSKSLVTRTWNFSTNKHFLFICLVQISISFLCISNFLLLQASLFLQLVSSTFLVMTTVPHLPLPRLLHYCSFSLVTRGTLWILQEGHWDWRPAVSQDSMKHQLRPQVTGHFLCRWWSAQSSWPGITGNPRCFVFKKPTKISCILNIQNASLSHSLLVNNSWWFCYMNWNCQWCSSKNTELDLTAKIPVYVCEDNSPFTQQPSNSPLNLFGYPVPWSSILGIGGILSCRGRGHNISIHGNSVSKPKYFSVT